jgi:hypothetical protein
MDRQRTEPMNGEGAWEEAVFKGDWRTVVLRVLFLYGLYMLVHQVVFLIAYFGLPEKWLVGSPWFRIGEWAAAGGTWSGQFVRTLVTNLGVVCGLCATLNLQRVKGFSVGYFMPIWLGLMTGLVLGTNSFVGMDLRGPLPFLWGTAQAMTIGGAEMLGYILVTAATVKLGIYRRESWRRKDRFERVGRLRDVRLEWAEWVALAMGIGLVIVGAWRES